METFCPCTAFFGFLHELRAQWMIVDNKETKAGYNNFGSVTRFVNFQRHRLQKKPWALRGYMPWKDVAELYVQHIPNTSLTWGFTFKFWALKANVSKEFYPGFWNGFSACVGTMRVERAQWQTVVGHSIWNVSWGTSWLLYFYIQSPIMGNRVLLFRRATLLATVVCQHLQREASWVTV